MTSRKPLHPRPASTTPTFKSTEWQNNESSDVASSDDEQQSYEYEDHNITEDTSQYKSSNISQTPTKFYQSEKLQSSHTKRSQNIPKENESSNFLFILVLAISVIAIAIGLSFYWKTTVPKHCGFETLRHRQPLQHSAVWHALSVGIGMLLNKQSSTSNVYLFMYQGGNSGGTTKVVQLINDIASETSVCFEGRRRTVQMGREDFSTPNGDYGYAIEQFKNKIKEGKVLLILNLNDIPALAARALHSICDTINPIARDVVIFLTLETSNTTIAGSAVQLARDTLYSLWEKQLMYNELDPLITRVTDMVLQLQH